MRYSGSKRRFAKFIVPIIEQELTTDVYYVEPFVGGCNIMSHVNHPLKIGADSNKYVIDMWRKFQNGTQPLVPQITTKEFYYKVKDNPEQHPSWIVGYVGNACSYGGAWWNGYANYNPNKKNHKGEIIGEDHIKEAWNETMKQIRYFKYFKETFFLKSSYKDLFYPPNSVIYLDPPYNNTKKYQSEFNSEEFWDWCREMKDRGYKLFISEYEAPEDFECIWEMKKKDGMGTTKVGTKQQIKIEKLFI